MDIKNKTVVITGGAQGLGFAIATQMAELGANLALIDMQDEVLAEAKAELVKLDVKVETYVANVSAEADVEAVFNNIVSCLLYTSPSPRDS